VTSYLFLSSHGVGSTAKASHYDKSVLAIALLSMMFLFVALPVILSRTNALNTGGSLHKTKGAKHRRAPTEDTPRLAI
jgi:hypothetical protein